jgi:hypothetical protein
MTLPRTVADVLADHVAFEVECIDRMYLNVWQPRLQHGSGAAFFFTGHRGNLFASTALMDPMTKAFVADIHHFIEAYDLDLVHFGKERKDDVTQRHLAGFTAEEGVLYVGRQQEKANVWRTQRRYDCDGKSYAWLVKTSKLINHFYFYCVDADFGPFFLKFATYFPYTAKLCINGHEWAKRQVAKAGIGFTALDNGFAAIDDAAALQTICDALGPDHIEALLRKWLAILPHPFTDDDIAAGYTYQLSILQAEFSLTHMLDRPASGRIFFDQVIADNLAIGRPDQIGLVFDRRIVRKGRAGHHTPGRFRTRIITDGVTPSLHVDYKHTKIKQYHKEGRALRTETTINDTGDFDLPKRLTSLPALRQLGFTANRRLLGVQHISRNPIAGADAFTATTAPIITNTGHRVAGLRFGDPRTHALLHGLLIHRLLPRGFTNRELRTIIAPLLGKQPEDITAGQMTYDLRRLRLHGLIDRIDHTHRYQVTDTGLATALFLTRAHDHLLRDGLADICDPDPPWPSPLRTADRNYQHAYDQHAQQAGLAA